MFLSHNMASIRSPEPNFFFHDARAEIYFSNLIIYSFPPFKAPVSVHGQPRGLEYKIANEKSNPVPLLHPVVNPFII